MPSRSLRLTQLVALCAALAITAFGPEAAAQKSPPHLSLERFQPTPGSGRILAIPTSRTMPMLGFTVELALDYARLPLGAASGSAILSQQLSGQLLAGIGFGRVDVGLALPATLYQSLETGAQRLLPGPVSTAALGDLRLNVKLRLTPEQWAGGVALEVLASFPTGNGSSFSGEDGLGVGGRAIADWTFG